MLPLTPTEQNRLQDYVVTLRRQLHQIPELGTHLPATSQHIADELTALGIPFQRTIADGSIVAVMEGGCPGKTVALRADMDGLGITEQTGLPFSSKHPGCMHACGHDAHAAMLLGAAKLLWEDRQELPGRVKLLFQSGEEHFQGARQLIEAGAMDEVDAVFGVHIGVLLGDKYPSGTFIVPDGGCMAAFDRFTLTIKGFGCHGSSPEKGVDPINIAAHVILSLQAIVAREIPAVQPAVLSLGRIQGGAQYNLIPTEVVLEGTTRALDQEIRMKLARRIEEIASATAAAFGGSCQCEIDWGAPPVINDPDMAALAAQAISQAIPDSTVVTHIDSSNMGGEDFAFYLQQAPGAYFFLSTHNPEKGTHIPHHNERFDIDEDVLWRGSAAYAAIARHLLRNS